MDVTLGLANGKRVILGSPLYIKWLGNFFFSKSVVLENPLDICSKLPSGLRKIIEVNDISYYTQK